MDQYEFIRTAHRVYGKNITELARETGHSRNTVKKAIRVSLGGIRSGRLSLPLPLVSTRRSSPSG
jgi:hypothetical protein